MYKFKRWQWALIICGLLTYFTMITFQVYGNFYLGYPPYTPAFFSQVEAAFNWALAVT